MHAGRSVPKQRTISIPKVAIAANGSFAGSGSQQEVFDNARPSSPTPLPGNFKGATPSGPETVGGTLREVVVFPANGTTETCTSNVQPWTATHNPQPAPTKGRGARQLSAPLSSGHYYGFSFSVAAAGRALTGVSVTDIVACTPAGSFPGSSQFVIPSVTVQPTVVAATGANRVSSTTPRPSSPNLSPGTSRGRPERPETVAGTLRETWCSLNGTTEMCTSNVQPWAAIHASRREAQRAWTLADRRRPDRRRGPAFVVKPKFEGALGSRAIGYRRRDSCVELIGNLDLIKACPPSSTANGPSRGVKGGQGWAHRRGTSTERASDVGKPCLVRGMGVGPSCR